MKDSAILRSRDWKKERQENRNQATPFSFPASKIEERKILTKGFFESFIDKLKYSANSLIKASCNYVKNDILRLNKRTSQIRSPEQNNLKITIIPSTTAQQLFPNLKMNPNVKCQDKEEQRLEVLPMPVKMQLNLNFSRATQTQSSVWKKINNETSKLQMLKELRSKFDQETQTNENDNQEYQASFDNFSKIYEQSNSKANPRRKKIKLSSNLSAVSAGNQVKSHSYLKFIEPKLAQKQQKNIQTLCTINQTQSQTSQIQERGKPKKHHKKNKQQLSLDFKGNLQKNLGKFEQKKEDQQKIQKEIKKEIISETVGKPYEKIEERKMPQKLQLSMNKNKSESVKTGTGLGLFSEQVSVQPGGLFSQQESKKQSEIKQDFIKPVHEIKLFGNNTEPIKQIEENVKQDSKSLFQLSTIKEEGEEETNKKLNTQSQESQKQENLFEITQINNEKSEEKKEGNLLNLIQQGVKKNENETSNNEQKQVGLFGNLSNLNKSSNEEGASSLFNLIQNQSNKNQDSLEESKQGAGLFSNLIDKKVTEPKTEKLFKFEEATKPEISPIQINSQQSQKATGFENNPFASALKPGTSQPPQQQQQNSLFGNLTSQIVKQQTVTISPFPPTPTTATPATNIGNLFGNQSPTVTQQGQSSLFGNSGAAQSNLLMNQPMSGGLFSQQQQQMPNLLQSNDMNMAMSLFQSTEQSGNQQQMHSLFENNSGKNSAQGKDSVKRSRNNKKRINDI